MGTRRAGGVPVEDLWRHLPRRQPGTQIPSYWRFDAFAEAKIDQNWKVKLFVNNVFNQTYYDALYQSATPFVFVAPGRAGYIVVSARF